MVGTLGSWSAANKALRIAAGKRNAAIKRRFTLRRSVI